MKDPKVLVLVLLVVAGAAYKFVLAPKKPAPKPKVDGTVYVLPKEFLVNLADGRFAKLQVGLVINPKALAPEVSKEGGTAPEGYGANPQEALVRNIITNELTEDKAADLTGRDSREKIQESLAKDIRKNTDVAATEVLFTDLTVQ